MTLGEASFVGGTERAWQPYTWVSQANPSTLLKILPLGNKNGSTAAGTGRQALTQAPLS